MLDDGFAAYTRDGGRTWVEGIVFDAEERSEFFATPDDRAATLAKAAREALPDPAEGGDPRELVG